MITVKKKVLWVVGICLLAVLSLTAALLLLPGDKAPEATQPVEGELSAGNLRLYWNVDGKPYRSGQSVRYKNNDGYFYITFAVDGKQERIAVADLELANAIDMQEVVGLVFDENGIVVDYRKVGEFTGGMIADKFYVTNVENGIVTCNSSVTLGGYDVVFTLEEDTPVYDVTTEGITCGIPGTVKRNDQVTVIVDKNGKVLSVYTRSYREPGALYWNVSRKFDNVTKRSTRSVDEMGCYTYEMLCNGEAVTVRTRDYEIACQMDSYNAPCMGLTFDENGYVIETALAKKVTEGNVFGSYSRVMQVKGNKLFTQKLTGTGIGTEYEGLLAENCKIINTTAVGRRGEYTELRPGDQIHGLTDNRGKLCYIFITSRVCEDEYGFCWNFDYVSGTKETSRKPDSQGVYRIKLSCDGKVFTGWTTDLNLVNMLDTSRFRGVKLGQDNEILDVIASNYVYGGSYFCSWYFVDKIEGDQITVSFTKSIGAETKVLTGTLSKDVQVYNTSKFFTNYAGEPSSLQVGDQIYAQNDMYGQIRAVYVVNRYLNTGVYYNLERKWDSANSCTARVPDSDGVYSFKMTYNGQQVTVKTRSRQVANDIDSQVANVLGLVMDGNGYCVHAVHANQTEECKGGVSASYVLVTGINGNQVSTYKENTGEYKTITLASDVKYMDVSSIYNSHRGEYTTLRVGDKIHCLMDQDKNTNYVYITDRWLDTGVYYNLVRKWSDAQQSTTRTPDADGCYSFLLAYDGQAVTLKTKDKAVADAIDSQVANVVGLVLDKDGFITKAVHAKQTVECKGGVSVSYVLVTGMDGSKVATFKENTGEEKSITLASDVKIINVSHVYRDFRGEYTQLREGDKIHCLMDSSKKTNYVYITDRKPEPVSHICEHGSEDTLWLAWNSSKGFTENGYYVLTEDATLSKRITVEVGQEVTLCLNGHTLTCTDRVFSVYGKLTICDHKLEDGSYAGSIVTSYSNPLDDQGNITTNVYGGLAYLYNEEQDVSLSILGGNYIHTGTVTSGGLVFVASTSSSGFGAELNLYDGTLQGGHATESGGAVAVRNVGAFHMYGGRITDCEAKTGAGVHVQSAGAVFTMENGKIDNCRATDVGAGVSIANGTATMTGGEVVDCTTTGNGGSVNLSVGSFTMTGGKLENGKAKEGGNLRIGSAATFTLAQDAKISSGTATNGGNAVVYGTLILQDQAVMENGTATNKGGNINAFANLEDATANIIMTGGSILGGTASVDSGSVRLDANTGTVNMIVTGGCISGGNAPHAAGVKVGSAEHISMTVGGNAVIDRVYLESGKTMQISADGLDETASFGVATADLNVPIVILTDAAQESAFHPEDGLQAKIVNVDNALYLETAHIHCICGGNLTGIAQESHSASCMSLDSWIPVSQSDFAVGGIFVAASTSGRVNFKEQTAHYYLTENVTTSSVLEILKGSDISLCLNGYTLTSTATGNSAIRLSGKLNICDCQGGGKVTARSPKAPGMVFLLTSTADAAVGVEFNLFGGDLVMTDNNYTANAGVIQVGNSGSTPGVFNMYGGSVSGGTANKGGNILIGTAAATMNLYGGTVSGGSVKTNDSSADRNRGGNIYVNQGTLNVYGGVITGGQTASDDPNPGLGEDIYLTGGNVFLAVDPASLKLYNDGTGTVILEEEGQ